MGILEEINAKTDRVLETLLYEVSILRRELDEVKEMMGDAVQGNGIVMRFSDDDIVNFTIAAKFLKLTQKQLDKLIQQGQIRTMGVRKRNFLAKDILEFYRSQTYISIKRVHSLKEAV